MNKSFYQTEIFEYVKSLIGDEVIFNDNELITPFELDIVIPSRKIAIEFNSLYYHCEKFLDNNYHKDKSDRCKEIGYSLIHIFEDEWKYNKQIVKTKIRYSLGLIKYRIPLKDCKIKYIKDDVRDEFLYKYHINGTFKGILNFGIFYRKKLVSVMVFDNYRFNNDIGFKIVRYASVYNFIINGTVSKFIDHFNQQFKNPIIVVEVDKRFGNGNVYKETGFKFIKELPPNSFTVRRNQTNKNYDGRIMKSNEYYKIFDCGSLLFRLN